MLGEHQRSRCLFIIDHLELRFSTPDVKHCFDHNKGKFIGLKIAFISVSKCRKYKCACIYKIITFFDHDKPKILAAISLNDNCVLQMLG